MLQAHQYVQSNTEIKKNHILKFCYNSCWKRHIVINVVHTNTHLCLQAEVSNTMYCAQTGKNDEVIYIRVFTLSSYYINEQLLNMYIYSLFNDSVSNSHYITSNDV